MSRERALELMQDARDAARRVGEDGFPSAAATILDALAAAEQFLLSEKEETAPDVRMLGGAVDQVFAKGYHFHLERISATNWWMAIEAGGKRAHINLHSKATIRANVETEDA